MTCLTFALTARMYVERLTRTATLTLAALCCFCRDDIICCMHVGVSLIAMAKGLQ